jgi:hypothetical protein
MVLTPEVIEHAKKEVAIEQYFQHADTPTAKHILFQEFIEKTKWKGLPKVVFYILMDSLYPVDKAVDGNLGYKCKLTQPVANGKD